MDITTHDIEAMFDVLDGLTEQSDGLSTEQAVHFRHALTILVEKARSALSLMTTQTLTTLEGQTKVVDGVAYTPKAIGKWRPEQGRIRSRVAQMSLFDPISGEMLEPSGAASRAVDLMYDLFVAPKDMPKASGLKLLRLEKSDVADWEQTGTELLEVAVDV